MEFQTFSLDIANAVDRVYHMGPSAFGIGNLFTKWVERFPTKSINLSCSWWSFFSSISNWCRCTTGMWICGHFQAVHPFYPKICTTTNFQKKIQFKFLPLRRSICFKKKILKSLTGNKIDHVGLSNSNLPSQYFSSKWENDIYLISVFWLS